IDRETVARRIGDELGERPGRHGIEADRQQAVVRAIVVEDAGVCRADERTDADLLKAPYRVFAARPAAEIRADDEKAGVPVAILVQDEIGARFAVLEAEQIERSLAEAFAVDALEEHL